MVQVAVGPVRGKFKMAMTLMPDPSRQRIELKVSGGGFGSTVDLKAGADAIDAGEGSTLLKWAGEAESAARWPRWAGGCSTRRRTR